MPAVRRAFHFKRIAKSPKGVNADATIRFGWREGVHVHTNEVIVTGLRQRRRHSDLYTAEAV
jgi:hypothetical protein